MKLPDLRDIFDNFELTEGTTPKLEKLDKKISSKLKERFSTFEEYDEISDLLSAIIYEAQATGFEQGYKFSIGLIKGGFINE